MNELEHSMKMPLVQWLGYYHTNVVQKQFFYLGIPTQKNPFDLWIYQEMIFVLKPDIIIEIGSAAGGSTLFLAHQLDHVGSGAVISVDIDRSKFKISHPRILLVTGDSLSPVVVNAVKVFCGEPDLKIMVIHDGNHDANHVHQNLCLYSPLVTVGSYLIVEDGIIDLMPSLFARDFPNGGPIKAIEKFTQENTNFEIDRTWEKFILTYNPCGFLKRVK